MEQIKIPDGYQSALNLHDTQIAIKTVKDFFQQTLAQKLNLLRVSAPVFVNPSSGLNDNLNGVERPVSFDIKGQSENAEIVHSLAKWKRYALSYYGFKVDEGLYTDMNAIRRDDKLDRLHSIYVDQWDWERVISKEERNIDFLKGIVTKIVGAVADTANIVNMHFPLNMTKINREVKFVTTQELEDLYPDKTPSEREQIVTREYRTVCIMQIGGKLKSGVKHDGRAPDYDDWSLNGDIFFWLDSIDSAIEISSMGIRVTPEVMKKQLEEDGSTDRLELPFHKALMNNELPLTIGGGIGQSRLCMLLLGKRHIGEVQASVWPDDMIEDCAKQGIYLL